MRIRLSLEYDGSGYAGFQVQPGSHGPTVQGVLEEAISRLTGAPVRVYPSGRTDAGVHARRQVVHFDVESAVPTERIPDALNGLLPPDVAALEAREVDASFHARKDAVQKTYQYLILNTPCRSALLRARTVWVRTPLDLSRMQEAAGLFEGRHDFAAFTSSRRSAATAVRTVLRSEIRAMREGIELGERGEMTDAYEIHGAGEAARAARVGRVGRVCGGHGVDPERPLLVYTVEADGFLMHMVRIMAGTLIEVGRGKLEPEDVGAALASRNRADAGPTAPPQGLYLSRVRY